MNQEKNIRPRGATQRGPCKPKSPKCDTIDTFDDERDSRLMFFGLFSGPPMYNARFWSNNDIQQQELDLQPGVLLESGDTLYEKLAPLSHGIGARRCRGPNNN